MTCQSLCRTAAHRNFPEVTFCRKNNRVTMERGITEKARLGSGAGREASEQTQELI
jgi:hypothetical protein